jgi:hypothetical protein
MDETTFRARVASENGFGIVRNRDNGNVIPCCWNDCGRPGRREVKVGVRDGEQVSIYFFCTERHRGLWMNSSRDLGNLPGGSRGMLI